MNSISLEKLTNANIDEVFSGLCYSFAKHEVMGNILQLEPNDLVDLFEPIIKNSINTSFIARDTTNNRIAGAIICNDFNLLSKLSEPHFAEKGLPIDRLLSSLENSFIKSEYHMPNTNNHTFYQFATYVSDDYGNRGIATSLYNISEKYAQENGYKNVLTISTGKISQHIRINKLGFKCIDEINYKTFEFNGINIFSQINQVDSCKCLVKILQ